jgi:hypothetical protein
MYYVSSLEPVKKLHEDTTKPGKRKGPVLDVLSLSSLNPDILFIR